jgi:MFS transporter, Spinster family, sphingosine-1-phosphate transporter
MIGGWRSVFYITGALGLVVALLIYFGVREMPRGKAEPEFEDMTEMQTFKFSWKEAREIFKKKTMWFIFAQGFAGIFPWNVITFFFFGYLETERGYDANAIVSTMAPVILILAAGTLSAVSWATCFSSAPERDASSFQALAFCSGRSLFISP